MPTTQWQNCYLTQCDFNEFSFHLQPMSHLLLANLKFLHCLPLLQTEHHFFLLSKKMQLVTLLYLSLFLPLRLPATLSKSIVHPLPPSMLPLPYYHPILILCKLEPSLAFTNPKCLLLPINPIPSLRPFNRTLDYCYV